MNLQFIKSDQCPKCGETTVISESVEADKFSENPRIREHCNRGRWEKRDFICGQSIKYCPNGSKEELSGECRNDIEIKNKKEKRKTAYDKVLDFIESLEDVDSDYKEILHNEVSDTKWRFDY